MTTAKVVNVVATASLGQKLDFEKLKRLKEICYNADIYGGQVAYFKTNLMVGRISLFATGNMISVGTKSEAQSYEEIQLTKQFLVKTGVIKNVDIQPITQNIVATVDFEQSLNLEELSQRTRAIYEPEQFPGAILRLEIPFKTSILVFASGKMVVTGLKSQSQIQPTVQALKQLIEQNQ